MNKFQPDFNIHQPSVALANKPKRNIQIASHTQTHPCLKRSRTFNLQRAAHHRYSQLYFVLTTFCVIIVVASMSVMQWMFLACLFCFTRLWGRKTISPSLPIRAHITRLPANQNNFNYLVVTSCVIFDTRNKSHSMVNNSQHFLSCKITRILIPIIIAIRKPKHHECDKERVFMASDWIMLGQSCLTNELPDRQRISGDWSRVILWSSWTLSQRCHANRTSSRPSLSSPWLPLLVTAGEIHWKWNTSLIKKELPHR